MPSYIKEMAWIPLQKLNCCKITNEEKRGLCAFLYKGDGVDSPSRNSIVVKTIKEQKGDHAPSYIKKMIVWSPLEKNNCCEN